MTERGPERATATFAGGLDTRHEMKTVLWLSLGFGLVGVDRYMIMPMFPVMMKDLSLDYQDLGHITAVLGLTWGVSAFFMGNLSDRIGRRKVIIPALVIFSLLCGFSGLATGLGGLLLVRGLMGFAEGAFAPAAITATLEASRPSRHGLNLGLQQATAPLLALGVTPILVTQLLQIIDWRWVFLIVSAPGLIVAWFLFKILRDQPPAMLAAHTATHDVTDHKWTDIFRYRNVPLNMIGMLCWLTCLMVAGALLPNYLTDYLHLDVQQMGFVLSAMGFGATLGTVAIPALSDRVGRKPVMILSVLGSMTFLWLLMQTGANPIRLFGFLFLIHFFNFGCIVLTVGPISAEAVPAKLMSTASGLVIGVGEVFGGAAAPAIGGYVAQHFGIQYLPYLAVGSLALGFLVVLSLEETAPCREKARRGAPSREAIGG